MKDKNKVELYLEYDNDLAESPHFDPRNRVLSWIDIPKGELITSDSRGKIKIVGFNEKIGCAIPLKRSNGFLVLGTTHIYIYEDDKITPIYDLTKDLDPSQRCNDANIDNMGRLWFSSIVDDGIHAPESKLYCYTNKELICMDSDLKLGNGICWNKKNNRMFVVDSIGHCIYVYDYDLDTGYISNRRILCNIYEGEPDGMIIDKDENLWVAIWNGGKIQVRSSKTGLLKKEYDVPTYNATCMCYKKEDKMLIITTAKGKDTYGGNLFSLNVDVNFDDFEYAVID